MAEWIEQEERKKSCNDVLWGGMYLPSSGERREGRLFKRGRIYLFGG